MLQSRVERLKHQQDGKLPMLTHPCHELKFSSLLELCEGWRRSTSMLPSPKSNIPSRIGAPKNVK